MNVAMGVVTWLFLHGQLNGNLTVIFSVLYSMNMFFQSYGAVSIIKVKAYWFHVRERGIFGAIFGTLISFGAYFAFDWGRSIADAAKLVMVKDPTPFQQFLRGLFAIDVGTQDAVWLVFFIPAGILVFWTILDIIFIKDAPEDAGFPAFDTHDASSDEDAPAPSMLAMIKKVVTHPVLLIVGLVEFTSGVLRNGVMQWYTVFAKDVPQIGAEIFVDNWGLWLAFSGIFGGFASGIISDKFFHSRRGPSAAILNGVMVGATVVMALTLFSSPVTVAICALVMNFAVIGVHSIMSGTAAADFGGKKATGTASGLVDAAVYFGSGVQSISLGYLTTASWQWWPVFLVPFAIIGMIAGTRIWASLPEATKRYLLTVEKVTIKTRNATIESERTSVAVTES
jgi:OPA family glycerol-3-phosphate transporter-like MFS transporter